MLNSEITHLEFCIGVSQGLCWYHGASKMEKLRLGLHICNACSSPSFCSGTGLIVSPNIILSIIIARRCLSYYRLQRSKQFNSTYSKSNNEFPLYVAPEREPWTREHSLDLVESSWEIWRCASLRTLQAIAKELSSRLCRRAGLSPQHICDAKASLQIKEK